MNINSNNSNSIMDFKQEFSFKTIMELFFLVIVIILFLRIFVLDFNQISSESMEPVLEKGDVVLISRISYFFGIPYLFPIINNIFDLDVKIKYKSPKLNDIIVFINESAAIHKSLVKRIVAIAGDTIFHDINTKKIRLNNDYPFESEIKFVIPKANNTIEINNLNSEFYYKYIKFEEKNAVLNNSNIILDNKILSKYKFNYDYYFVMGDNFNNSLDSRDFGLISEKWIIGRPILILLSSENNNLKKDRFFKLIK